MKIFSNYITNEWFISEIYKELPKLFIKKAKVEPEVVQSSGELHHSWYYFAIENRKMFNMTSYSRKCKLKQECDNT
jgi:hypothetical protein